MEKEKKLQSFESQKRDETNLIVRAAATLARKQMDVDLGSVLKETLISPSKIRKLCSVNQKNGMVFSVYAALACFHEYNFTKKQYNAIFHESKLRNCDIYTHYNEILAAKLKCRSDGIHVNETVVRASLESYGCTTKIIVGMKKEVFEAVMQKENTNFLKS